MLRFLVSLFVALSAVVVAQIPCDAQYGEFCPDKAGLDVGVCLKNLGEDKLPKECRDYIQLHETCAEDIKAHCVGKEYTGDLLVCLTEWTNPSVISAGCKDALPKKQATKDRKLSADEIRRSEERKKIRDKAKRNKNKGKKDL